jgi:hypothetical protein
MPTSPSHRCAIGPSLSPLKGGERKTKPPARGRLPARQFGRRARCRSPRSSGPWSPRPAGGRRGRPARTRTRGTTAPGTAPSPAEIASSIDLPDRVCCAIVACAHICVPIFSGAEPTRALRAPAPGYTRINRPVRYVTAPRRRPQRGGRLADPGSILPPARPDPAVGTALTAAAERDRHLPALPRNRWR